jgi:hypothetical protein
MALTGTLLRIIGAAILLIAVQFASVAARAHVAHGHAPEGHHLQGHHFQGPGVAAGIAHAVSFDEVGRIQPAAQAEATVQNTPGAQPSDSDACVMGCCGCTGCCGAALAAVSPNLPPQACSLRIGFACPVSVPEVDPRGLRKPPRSLA